MFSVINFFSSTACLFCFDCIYSAPKPTAQFFLKFRRYFQFLFQICLCFAPLFKSFSYFLEPIAHTYFTSGNFTQSPYRGLFLGHVHFELQPPEPLLGQTLSFVPRGRRAPQGPLLTQVRQRPLSKPWLPRSSRLPGPGPPSPSCQLTNTWMGISFPLLLSVDSWVITRASGGKPDHTLPEIQVLPFPTLGCMTF